MHFRALTAALILLSLPAASSAQPQCAPRAVVLERLASGFGETRQSVGLAQGSQVVEVFASEDTGSWTINETGQNLPAKLCCFQGLEGSAMGRHNDCHNVARAHARAWAIA